MPTTDRSQTERLRRLRAKVQATGLSSCLTANNNNPKACPDLGPGVKSDYSTWLNRRFGQQTYLAQLPNGVIVSQSCCDSSTDPSTGPSSP